MAKRNYTKYYKTSEQKEEASSQVVIREPINKDVNEYVEEQLTKIGFVSGCTKLNVRKESSIKSAVVCVVDANTELEIDIGESTDDFYKVYTVDGLDGFCMKQYISIA